jgi:hypothetical protein
MAWNGVTYLANKAPFLFLRALRVLRARPSLFVLKLLHKLDRLFINRQDDAAVNRGFIYHNGNVTVLGVLLPVGASPGPLNSYAENINDLGQVVGSSSQEPFDVTDPSDPEKRIVNPGFSHGFIYFKGAMYDLNAMLSAAPSDLVITDAFFINDIGQILAVGTTQGHQGQIPCSCRQMRYCRKTVMDIFPMVWVLCSGLELREFC